MPSRYQRDNGKDVDASIDLDGIVPNDEKTYRYTDSPLRRRAPALRLRRS